MTISDQEIGAILKRDVHAIAREAYGCQMEMMPEIKALNSETFEEKSIRDTEYTVLYLSNAISVSSQTLFTSYVNWFVELMESINIPVKYLRGSLVCIYDVISKRYDDSTVMTISPTLDAGIRRVDDYVQMHTEATSDNRPLTPYRQKYIQHLLKGERKRANDLVMDLVSSDYPIQDIYLEIFQESQHEIGKLWKANKITIAEEHYCTAATQLIMGQLYPLIFATPKNDRVFVGTCVGGELHELGVRMVADFFELGGWNTYYLGANTPAKSIIETIVKEDADIVGISVTMTFHIEEVVSLIQQIRSDSRCRNVKILVGGYPFLLDDALWRKIGADGYAKNAREALIVAEQLIVEVRDDI